MDSGSTGRLSEDGHVVWVSSEVPDVVPHPLQSLDHVLQTVVSRGVRVLSAQEAQGSQAVVDGHHDHVLVHQMIGAVGECVSIATGEGSSVDPHHHGQIVVQGLRVDTQVETVLVHRGGQPGATGTGGAMFQCRTNTSPRGRIHWGTESEVTHRSGSVVDTLEAEIVAADATGEGLSLDLAVGRLDYGIGIVLEINRRLFEVLNTRKLNSYISRRSS